ncbi:hypothetical protein KFU94_60460 [Chloroflexi bacterium TSY]|nr:hypothetical protein [Chloroflexi bacterium TSY]
MAFSRTHQMPIAKRPSHEPEISTAIDLSQAFQEYQIQIRCHHDATELTTPQQVIDATLAHALLNARSAYQDAERGLSVVVEYPVNLINLNVAAGTFQVCTGPIILPDLSTWNGESVQRVFLAHVAFTQFDYVEFILRREVEAAPEERVWLDSVRGRDRLELHDPEERPPNYPPSRPRPLVYNETWGFDAQNVILQVPNQ